MKITRKYLIGKICVLFALTVPMSALGKAADDQTFSYGEEFRCTQGIMGGKIYGHDFSSINNDFLTKQGIKLGANTANSHFDLQEGNILFAPDKPIVIETPYGNIHLASGSVIFIMQSKDGLIIYDLRQSLSKQVKVIVDKYTLYSAPAYVMVLTRQNFSDYENLPLNCHSIVYRRAREIPLPGIQTKVFAAEYSISAGLLTIQPLRQLITSNDKQDKLIFERIIQAAAGLDDFLGPIQPSQLANMSRQL